MKTRGLLAAATCSGVLVLALLSPRAIPYCMDEFVHYHALGCAVFPLSRQYNHFREGCGSYDLRLPFTSTFLPLRSYQYIGSLPAVPFYPFWRLLRDPVAVRVQGAVFFLLATWLVSRWASVGVGSVLLASAVFPLYPFAFLVDLGPSGLSLLVLTTTLLLLEEAVRSAGRRRVVFAALAGLGVFVGFFIKLVFAWCLPALALFALVSVRRREPFAGIRNWLPATVAFLVVAVVPTSILLQAEDVEGSPYYGIVREGHISLETQTWNAAERMGHYFVDGSAVIPRTLALPPSVLDILPALLSLSLVAFALVRWRDERGRTGFMALLAVATFATIVLTRSAWAPHHFVFALFFWVAALARVFDRLRASRRGVLAASVALVVLYWGWLGFRLPDAKVNPDTNAAKDALIAYVREAGLDRRFVQVHTTWGTYYIAHLFGDPQQIVLYANALPDQPDRLEEIRAVANETKRGLLVISARERRKFRTKDLMATLGPPAKDHAFGNWHAYEFEPPWPE